MERKSGARRVNPMLVLTALNLGLQFVGWPGVVALWREGRLSPGWVLVAGVCLVGVGIGLASWTRGFWVPAVRGRYAWFVWEVVGRPVRDELDVKVSLERDEKKAALDADLRSALPDLGDDGVQVLEVLLGNYQGASERVSVIRPDMDRLDPWDPRSGAAERRVRFACDELKMEGFLAKFASFSDEFGSRTVVVLGRGLPDGLVQRMHGWARDELISRAKPLRENRHPPVPRPPKGPPPKRVLPKEDGPCRAEIAELSSVSADVLHAVLEAYGRWPGEVVRIDVKEYSLWVNAHADHDDEAFRRALGDLEEAGFLRSVSRVKYEEGYGVELMVAECLEARSVARAVAKWVEEEMTHRGVWGQAS